MIYHFYKIDYTNPTTNTLYRYVGKTINIINRCETHNSGCNNPNYKGYNSKVYRTMREYGYDNFVMTELFQLDCDLDDARQQEGELIISQNANLNSNNPNRMRTERDTFYMNRKANKFTCPCGSVVSKGNICNHNRTNKHKLFIEEN